MLTRIAPILIIVITCLEASAQNFSLGIKAGASLTWADFANIDAASQFNTVPKLGYTVGGVIQFPLKNRYSFLSEFSYSQKGRRVKFNEDTWENNATYHFIDLSMALRRSYRIKIKKDVSTKLFFNIGPNIEYWLDGKGEIITDVIKSPYQVTFDKTPTSNYNINYINGANRWLFGLDIGVGAEASITKTQRIHTELRFTYGQTYLGQKSSSSTIEILGFTDNIQANFKTLTLSVSYYFDFDLHQAKMGKSTKDKEIRRKPNRKK